MLNEIQYFILYYNINLRTRTKHTSNRVVCQRIGRDITFQYDVRRINMQHRIFKLNRLKKFSLHWEFFAIKPKAKTEKNTNGRKSWLVMYWSKRFMSEITAKCYPSNDLNSDRGWRYCHGFPTVMALILPLLFVVWINRRPRMCVV